MKYISADTLHNFCRACLKQLGRRQRFKIQSLDLQIQLWLEYLNEDDPLALNDSICLSNSVCLSCRNKLNEFLEFRLMCTESKKKILHILTNKNESIEAGRGNNHLIEPLIDSICSLNGIERTDSRDNNESCSNRHEVYAIEVQKESNESLKSILYESEKSHTESDSDIHIEEVECTNSEEEMINKPKPKPENINSKVKARRKKYTYTFRCDQCKYRCVSQQILNIHMRIHCGLRPYKCSQCEESFDKSSQMLKHLYDMHGEKELIIICEYEKCGKRFNSSRSYKDHYRQSHIPQQQMPVKREKYNPYKHVCEECGKTYTKLQTFKEHQYTHGPKEHYPYQCDQCDKAFVKQKTFNEHKLRHAGIKMFECPQCGARKTTKKELRSHMNSHTRERKYPCPNCPMVFYRSSNRRIHVDVVHQRIRRFACRYCDQTFGKGDNLKNHELLHTGEKPHACSECGKRFVQRVSLRSHMKTHNK